MENCSSEKILLSSPTMHGEEQLFIKEAFDRNWIAPLGFNCDGFEKEMVEYLKQNNIYSFATVSGTAAIHLAVKLAKVKQSQHVICSDLTFSATVNPTKYEGAIPVFVDSEKETWNMNPDLLDKALTKYKDAKVVVIAHLYGTPAKIDEILNVCKKHDAILIEDAAEALSAKYKGQYCGTFGKYGILSFNGNKIITTSGGGMLLTKSQEERDKAMFIATQAREKAPWYQHEELGYNYRMSNVVAGIGRGQLIHLNEHKALKEQIYHNYQEGLADLPVRMNPFSSDSEPNFWLSCLTVNDDAMCNCQRTDTTTSWTYENGKTCPDEIAKLLSDNHIETRPIWKPMHLQPYYKDCDYITEENVGEDIFRRGICLPSDIKMNKDAQDKVINIIRSAFN